MSRRGISFCRPRRVIDGTMGLREEKKVEQRRAILDAAVALFRKRGYEQTRVQDIITRLRISRTSSARPPQPAPNSNDTIAPCPIEFAAS